MVYPGQLRYIKRKSWRVRRIHVSIERIEVHPDYPEARLKGRSAQRIERTILKKGFKGQRPLRVVPHPEKKGRYQLIEGHRRLEATKKYLQSPGASQQGRVELPVVVEQDYPREKYDTLFNKKRPWWKRLLGRR